MFPNQNGLSSKIMTVTGGRRTQSQKRYTLLLQILYHNTVSYQIKLYIGTVYNRTFNEYF